MRAASLRSLRSFPWALALLLPLAVACGGKGGPFPAAGAAGGPLVVVVGTAQDGGLPHPACRGPHCEAARRNPVRRRLVASLGLVLPAAHEVYLVDATPDITEQLYRLRRYRPVPEGPGPVDRRPVEGIFLTHAHIGHYLGLAELGFEAVHAHGIPTFATPKMAGFLRGNGPWDQLVRLGEIDLVEIEPGIGGRFGRAVELGEGVSVSALTVPHRDEYSDTVGFRIQGPRRTLLYVPDTDGWDTWPRPLTEMLDGVDVALLDGTFYSPEELPGRKVSSIGHPLMRTTMDLLAPLVEGGRLEVDFTHLNHTNPALEPEGEALREIESRGFHVLAEGQEIPL